MLRDHSAAPPSKKAAETRRYCKNSLANMRRKLELEGGLMMALATTLI